jgi:hypothetical protein
MSRRPTFYTPRLWRHLRWPEVGRARSMVHGSSMTSEHGFEILDSGDTIKWTLESGHCGAASITLLYSELNRYFLAVRDCR